MNTTAIASSVAASGADASKILFQDKTTTNPSFNDILTKEMSAHKVSQEPHTASSKEQSSSAKTQNNKTDNSKTESNATSAAASSSSAPAEKTKSASETEKDDSDQSAEVDPAAEQMLLLAAQFIPVNPEPQAAAVAASETPAAMSAADLLALSGATAQAKPATSDTASITDTLPTVATEVPESDFSKSLDNIKLALNQTDERSARQGTATAAETPLQAADLAALKTVANNPLDQVNLAAAQALNESTNDKSVDAVPSFAAAMAPLQQAAATAETVAASAHIAPQVGTSAWNQSIGQKIVWMVGNEEQSASLTLNPPDLGPMHVVLNISKTQANASFYSPHAEVRDALEAALPKLREMLGDAGIQLGQANVNAGTPQQQENFASSMPSSWSSRSGSTGNEVESISSTSVATPARAIREGLVDTFV